MMRCVLGLLSVVLGFASAATPVPADLVLVHGNRVVLPGIIDAHTHPAQSAQDLGKCSLDDKALTPADVKSRVAACLRQMSRLSLGEIGQWT
jgi:imidazolonepropionase-like amidohydrolase